MHLGENDKDCFFSSKLKRKRIKSQQQRKPYHFPNMHPSLPSPLLTSLPWPPFKPVSAHTDPEDMSYTCFHYST